MTSEDYIVRRDRRPSMIRIVFYFLLFIIVFITIIFPFFTPNLRYEVGFSISTVTEMIGRFVVSIGGLMVAWGLLSLFLSKSTNGVKLIIIGAILIFLGASLGGFNEIISFFGGNQNNPGYH